MFTRAGFNRRHRVVCWAWIGRWGWTGGPRVSALVRFKSGDYAWWGRGGITWTDFVMIFTRREVLGSLERGTGSLPQSSIDRTPG